MKSIEDLTFTVSNPSGTWLVRCQDKRGFNFGTGVSLKSGRAGRVEAVLHALEQADKYLDHFNYDVLREKAHGFSRGSISA